MSDKNFKVKNGIDAAGKLTITNTSGATSLIEVNGAGGGQFTVTPYGGISTNAGFQSIGGPSYFGGYGGTTSVVVNVTGASGQTEDLQRWTTFGGTVLAKVDSAGSISATDLTLSGNLIVNGTTTNLNSTNLIIEDKNIIIADVATPTDTTADGAGITIKGATDKTFNWVNSTKSFTSSEPLIINNTSTTTVPLTINGYASQTSNLFEIKDSSSNVLFKITPPAGNFAYNNRIVVRPGGSGGPAQIGSESFTFRVVATGSNVIGFGTHGGGTSFDIIASDTFNRYRIIGAGTGVAPTFTTEGNDTDVNMYITAKGAGKIGINKTSPTGYVHAVSSSSSTVGLIVEGASGQTSTNIFEVQRAGGGDASFSVSHNYIDLNRNTTAAASMTVYGANAGAVPLYVKGRASQTANLQEWQNDAGTVLSSVSSNGKLYVYENTAGASGNALDINQGSGSRRMVFGSGGLNVGSTASVGSATWNALAQFEVYPAVAGRVGLVIKGAASQTADLQQWQDSSGNILATLKSSGTLVINGTNSVNSVFGITMTNKPIVHYYTGNNTSYQAQTSYTRGNTTGIWMNMGTTGDAANGVASIDIRDGGNTQLFSVGYTGNTLISLNSASSIGLIIKGAASQTADLQQWHNSAGTSIASVDSVGNISDASNTKWLSPIGGGSDDAPTIQSLIDSGKKEIRLGSGQWTFSTRIKVPNGVILKGIGSSTTSTTGTRVNAVALIASEGTVRDITFTGAGENSQNEVGGGIAVLGGRVIDCSVSNSRIVLAPTRQPHGYLKNFMSKMQSGYGSVKVAVLGDSLSENTSTTSWYGYLFNSTTTATGYYLGSYFSHQIAPSEVDNMAIGGQGAYLLSAQLAMTKETLRTGGYVNQVLDGDRISSSPFFNRDYNLAILAIGQNGGEDWKAHLEYTVKTIRDKGIDVIILTQNPAAGNPTSRAGDEYYYRSIAETYGCLLVDTQAYFRLEVEFGRALGTTADLFGDGIHQSALGHQLYAKAILNALLDYDSTIPVPANKTVVSRSYIPAQSDRATVIAGLNTYYLVKKPDSLRDISGVTYTTATDTSIRNPIYGRGTTTNSVATIASGGYATWGVEYANAAYIIYRENATANTLTVAIQGGGSTLATLTTGVTNGRTSVQKVTLAGGYPSNRPIRITNTSGDPVQIYGVVFETHADVAFNRNTDGSYAGVKLNGAWSYSNFLSMSSYSGYLTPHTSTTNDSVTFKFYGDGLRFATSYGKNSGIIQVKIDDTTYNAVDTYLNIGEYGVYTHFYGGLEYGLHTATITLTGANEAVTGLTSDGARFGLHRISAVRSKWYLTQDQQFAPDSDTSSIVNSVSSIRMGSVGGANIATFYNGTSGYGAGAITSTGTFNINGANMGFPYTSSGATLNVNAGSSSTIPVTVKGVSGQTANLQEWQNSAGTALAKLDIYGNLISTGIIVTPSLGAFANATVQFKGTSPSIPILALQPTSGSSTGDALVYYNASGSAVLAKLDYLGNFSAVSKSFDIPHPTKENMRLRYASLEGPENGVYIRGTAESNIIELPDYWTGLVHENSITVSLTAVGSAQNIYVEKIEDNKVYIGGELTKAFFTVYGERKDIDKLTVEY